MLNANGQEVKQTDDILKTLYDFYTELYQTEELSPPKKEIAHFLECIPALPKVHLDTQQLISPITAKEVKNAIKRLKIGKAPGMDGLTVDFYKFFAEDLDDILASVFNEVLEDGSLSPSQKIAIITILFKKGDSRLVSNYRPISLTNCDYKILAYILAIRLEEHLLELIHLNQTAYMKNHFIGTNIRSVQDVITNHASQGKIVVLFLDFCKAFDSVNHLFMMCLLMHISLPPEYVSWV